MDAALFLRELRATGLLEDEAMERSVHELSRRSGDARALAGELIRRNLITRYQAGCLLRGHGQRLLFGPYRYRERAGRSEYGRVYRAIHVALGRECAVKILRIPGPNRSARLAFERDTLPAAGLTHANLATVLEAFERRALYVVVSEWLAGCNLEQYVSGFGPAPVTMACGIAVQIAEALRAAHDAGLPHLTLDPGSVMVQDVSASLSHYDLAAPGLAVKVLNLGLGWRAVRRHGVGELLLPSAYLAPEQLHGSGPADPRSDQYALGGCLYLMLTGQAPERTNGRIVPAEERRPDVPPELAALLRRLLARDAVERYRSVGPVLEALRPLCARLSSEDVGTDPDSATVAELWGSETAPLLPLRRRKANDGDERPWDVGRHLAWAAGLGLGGAALVHVLRSLW